MWTNTLHQNVNFGLSAKVFFEASSGVLVLPKFCKIVARQVFGRLCSIVCRAHPLKLPIQALPSVAPTGSVF